MKRFLFAVMAGAVALVVAFAAAGCSPAKSAAMSEADAITGRQIDGMLENRLYKVDFTRASPTMAPSFHLNYPYYVSVIGDRVESFLPYFGRAYSTPYDGGEGLRFEAPITEYGEAEGRNGRRDIRFRARTTEDTYDFFLRIFPLGECNLTITPMQKQSISFSGRIDLEPKFEAVRVQ